MADVLLINPPNNLHQYGGGTAKEMVSLGILSIGAVLEQAGFGVRILDLEFIEEDVVRVIDEEKPIVVGIGGTSTVRFSAFEVAKTVKMVNSDIITVFGGCHATFTAQDTLEHVPEFDIIVHGEAEMTMLELLQHFKAGGNGLSKIKGISYRENGRIMHNSPRPRINDLDVLPMPAKHLVNVSEYNLQLDLIGKKAASIVTSRGCPINCSFCSASAMFGKKLTKRGARKVVDEMEYAVKHYGAEGFKIFDSTFTLSRDHTESICDEMIRRGITLPWECEIRVNTVNPPLLKKMKDAGCYLVDYGVESASKRVLQRMHKGINMKQVENVMKWLRDIGISQRAFFTFGHIGETMEDAEETLAFIQRNLNVITMPNVGVGIRVYPGTEVERYALANGYLSDFSWSEPYYEENNKFLNLPTNIPTLVQPELGFSELYELHRRVLAMQAASPRFLLRRILKAHSWTDWKRYFKDLPKLFRS